MLNNIHSFSHGLGTFGWNFSSIGDVNLSADSDGNIYVSNLGIENVFSQQATSNSASDSSNSINSRQLLQPYSPSPRIFQQQADGSYAGNGGTLTWNVDHYELEATNGSKIVFRPNGRLNYV